METFFNQKPIHFERSLVLRKFFNLRFLSALFCLLLWPTVSIAQKVTEVDGTRLSLHGQLVAKEILRYFPDAPYMLYIANCESRGLIHRDKTGQLRPNSERKSSAGGVFQLLLKLHGPEMQERDLDPERFDHYLKFVRHLYDERGVQPWKASRSCWGRHYNRLTSYRPRT
jgi:hypothetical protein